MQHFEWLVKDRLSRFKSQLANISRSEFLPASTSKALEAVGGEISRLETILDEVSAYREQIYLVQHATLVNQKIYALTNYLGVLLRSTNLRNAFEAHFAFEEMSRKFIGEDDKLIISSEWDSTPFYIPNPPAVLDGYVFIGMPAFASRNALLLPLAAHELGHAIWRIRSIDGPLITTADMFLREEIEKDESAFQKDFGLEQNLFFSTEKERIVSECLKLVASQSQEVFCDLFGAALFGQSYLYAFDFFLSPGFGTREYDYPSLSERVRVLKDAVQIDDLEILNRDFVEKATTPSKVPAIVELADTITKRLQPGLAKDAKKIASSIEYEDKNTDSFEDLTRNLRIGIPPRQPRSPVDILNAVWSVFLEKRSKTESFEERWKLTSLMTNLCLKSLEIYEYNRIKP